MYWSYTWMEVDIMKNKKKNYLLLMFCISLFFYMNNSSVLANDGCDHFWSQWEHLEPSCTEDGGEYRYCYYCDQKEYKRDNVRYPATGHTWCDWYYQDMEDSPTCVRKGKECRFCVNCYIYQYREVPITEHQWSGWSTVYSPTCTEKGKELRNCYICNAEQFRSIPATGHYWDDWEIEESPTIFHKGMKTRMCEICMDFQSKKIPKRKLTKSGKKAIKAAKKYAKYVRVYDVPKMKSCFVKRPKNFFFEKKWYLAIIARKYNKKKYRYKAYDVVANKKYATVKLKITYPDGYKPFMKTFRELAAFYSKYPKASSSASDSFMQHHFAKNVNKQGMKKSKQIVSFKMKKTKKGWKIRKASFDIENTSNCGYEEAYVDF